MRQRDITRGLVEMPTDSLRMDLGGAKSGQLSVIYDGACSVCTRIVRLLKVIDRSNTFVVYDYHEVPLMQERFPVLKGSELEEAMHVITRDRRIYRGYRALRRMLMNTPLRPVVAFLYFPAFDPIGVFLYNWFARNRRRFGCTSDRCAVLSPS